MSYELDAVIGDFGLLRSRTAGVRGVHVAPLRQGMGLVPVAGALRFPALEETLGDWSGEGPVAHVEAEFHGGTGHQSAALWRAGVRVWGPVRTRDFTGPRETWPINAALALLGVTPGGAGKTDRCDLFQEAGLGWERDTEGWLTAGQAALWAADHDEWYAEHERTERAAAEAERARTLQDVPAALDGKAIMDLLGLRPGPLVGAATRHLKELHLELGPLTAEEAVARLRAWAAEQGAEGPVA
ncbi:hypothetical protein ACIA8O_26470 [Kitasatospora sp. NPDC051853]|uniref:hypothetical protein n=1 Tax=Kitasatospora sp. NPDC051853 TaxID=3364058 RepID=UPI00378C70B0